MNARVLFRFFLGAAILLVPCAVTYAALIPQCPATGCRMCDLVTLANNIMKFMIWLSAFVVVAVMVVSGFNMIIKGESGEFKGSLMNIVVGIIIMLIAWVTVDTIMKVLVGGRIGPWYEITCVDNPQSQTIDTSGGTGAFVSPTVVGGGKGAGAQCSAANSACSVDALKASGMSEKQANAMSCIAMTESTGNPNTKPSPTGACGLFQFTNQTSKSNWQNPKLHGPGCSVNTPCNDVTCQQQTANIMLSQQGYQPWTGINSKTGQPWNPGARACVDKYDPGAYNQNT